MKKKTILGVGLTLMLLGSLLAAAAPVSGATLLWTSVTPPSTVNNVLAPVTDVTDIAVFDEDTMFAGIGDNVTYKTTNGGVGWSSITTDEKTNLIAVAPDDADVVVYADTSTKNVWLTTNGGTTWGDLSLGSDVNSIRDLAISTEKVGKHYIAVAGDNTTSNLANVWVYDYGAAAPSWTSTRALTGFSAETTGGIAAAVAFSPNFASDEVMVALTGSWDSGSENICAQMYSFDSSLWNASAGFISWPTELVADDGITGLTNGSISLDPDYLGSDDSMRMVFAGLNIAGDSAAVAYNGIYRADDTLIKAIKDGATLDINSVAYNGLNLVAGEVGTNTTYYCADPTATTPTMPATSTYKRPGGQTLVVVAWAGDKVVAGTTGTESAFSVSENDGKSYNDIALIDTVLLNMRDIAVSSDGSNVYLVTDNGTTNLSVFRYASAWERVLSIQDREDFLVRLAPEDPDVVYVASRKTGTTAGARSIYYSADAGETRWQLRACYVDIQDLAIEADGDVAYALRATDGKVAKSTNSGFTWGSPESTKLNGGNMIASVGEDELIVGSDDSYVAYSDDGNDSWTKIPKTVVDGGSLVQTIASGVADDDYVYAAAKAADYIYRWQLGESAAWRKIYTSAVTGNVTGINLQGKVLYAMATDGTDSVVYRTTNATLFPTVYWSTMSSTGVFGVTPQSLSVSAGSYKLWAINTESTDAFFSYTDTLIDAAPTLNSPKQDFGLKVNQVTGKAEQVTFVWERPSDEVTAYELKIALDSGFDEQVWSLTKSESGDPISFIVGPGIESGAWELAADETTYQYVWTEVNFIPDTTYFWRVRVSSPIKSQYSEVRRFVVAESTVTPPVTVEIPPAPPTPEIKITVPPPTKVEIPPAPPAPAPITPGYIWAIIIIGAILVIALVVLIIRTRRVV